MLGRKFRVMKDGERVGDNNGQVYVVSHARPFSATFTREYREARPAGMSGKAFRRMQKKQRLEAREAAARRESCRMVNVETRLLGAPL